MTLLPRNLGDQSGKQSAWQELSEGAPTILGFANLCSWALVKPPVDVSLDSLSEEARTILALARERGTIDIRAHRNSFDSVERFLAVCVEHAPDQRLLFLRKDNPQQTVKFLEGFRELCESGLILHHLQKDFSLSSRGFSAAKTLRKKDFEDSLKFAVELDD